MFGNWFGKRKYPDFWKQYEGHFHKLPSKTPLREIPFAVIDTETTGLNPGKDKILSIGGVKVFNGAMDIAQALDIMLQQDRKPQQEDIAIHGILPVAHSNQLSVEEALELFLDWIGSAVLVGHHVNFDLAVINKALERCGCGKLRNISLDTITLARRTQGGRQFEDAAKCSLDALADQFSIPLHDRHTAAGDAFITGILLLKLLNRLEGRGIHTLKDLLWSPH